MKSISLFVLFWASINIHAVDNLRIPDIRSLGMGGSGVTQSVLFNPALVALNTDKVLHLEYFNRCCRQVLISLLSDMISIGKLFFGYR